VDRRTARDPAKWNRSYGCRSLAGLPNTERVERNPSQRASERWNGPKAGRRVEVYRYTDHIIGDFKADPNVLLPPHARYDIPSPVGEGAVAASGFTCVEPRRHDAFTEACIDHFLPAGCQEAVNLAYEPHAGERQQRSLHPDGEGTGEHVLRLAGGFCFDCQGGLYKDHSKNAAHGQDNR
jgi:hypothetical protein